MILFPFKTICHHSEHKAVGVQRRGPRLCLENSKRIARVEAIRELGHRKLFCQLDQEGWTYTNDGSQNTRGMLTTANNPCDFSVQRGVTQDQSFLSDTQSVSERQCLGLPAIASGG